MAGHRAERKSVGTDWRAPAAAVATAAALFASVLLVLLSGWPSTTARLPAPPPWFWLALVLVAASSGGAYALLRSRAHKPALPPAPAPRAARAAPRAPAARVDRVPKEAPVRKEVDLDTFLAEIAEGPVAPVTLPPAAAEADPAPASEALSADLDLSKLEEWLDTVTAQVSDWAGVAASLDEPAAAPPAKEPAPESGPESWTPVLVSPPGGEDAAGSGAGAWTEPRARTAIERYLRMKPWAHPTTVAEALDMDLRLAMRVIGSLRRDARP